MKNIDFRSLVRDVIRARGWSVYYLARLSGVHRSSLSRWLRGRSDLSGRNLSRVLAACGWRG